MIYPTINTKESPSKEKNVSHSPEKEMKIRKKIKSFGSLEEGWDFGVGSPAPPNVVNSALALYDFGRDSGFEMDAFPGAGGDISVDFYIKDELVQILINTDLTYELTHEVGIGFNYKEVAYFEDINFPALLQYLTRFRTRGYLCSWTLCERLTEESTKKGLDGSTQIFLKNAMTLFPSLTSNAFRSRA
jgi:hypothetical protein